MTFGQLLVSGWDWEPSVILGCFGLMIGYLFAVRFCCFNKALFFSAGVLILLLALVSPLDTLADNYLFSAHMLQHLVLVLVVPPLLLLGIPESTARRALKWRFVERSANLLGHPLLAWLLGMGTFWVWHMPALYNAALANERLHIAEHLSFLASSAIFWSPVLSPVTEKRLSPAVVVLYLMPAGMINTLLGIVLAFFPGVLYPAYLHPADPIGILHLIRNEWGLSARSDQELGGMLMWFPGGLVYAGVILTILFRWFVRSARVKPSST